MGCSQQQAGASPEAGQGGALALQLLTLPGPGARWVPGPGTASSQGSASATAAAGKKQQRLGQEETLLSHCPAPARPLEGARMGSMPGEKSPT